jgi:hypothetical protein
MADTPVVIHQGENSPEQVAYKLLETIASNEGKTLRGSSVGKASAERKWLLDTYAECLQTVRLPGQRPKPA